jgi:hypothetical protein
LRAVSDKLNYKMYSKALMNLALNVTVILK